VIDERTVSRYLPRGSTSPDQLQRWLVFLRNHRDGLVGMDFFTVPTVSFGLLWVFVVLHHERRRVMRFAVTDRPAAPWIVQQLREAFPFDTAPRYAILDRDGKYGLAVPEALRNMGVKEDCSIATNGVKRREPAFRTPSKSPQSALMPSSIVIPVALGASLL
jgi:hypothetical protein